MHYFTLSLATLATVASALPTPKETGQRIPVRMSKRHGIRNALAQGTFTPAKGNGYVNQVLAKYAHTLKNYHANTGEHHPLYNGVELDGLSKRQAEPLTDEENNELWNGQISIGSGKQTFSIDFDTGSSDLWVPNESCTSATCNAHTKYDPSKSTTSTKKSGSFSITYGDQSGASGPIYTDDVTVGGLTAKGQTFSAVTKDTVPKSDPSAGIAGMGFPSISNLKSDPFFQTLQKSGQVKTGQFGFALTPKNAELYLGGTDKSLYTGDFTYSKLTQESYWVTKGTLTAAGTDVLSDSSMIIDTGTSIIVGSTAQAQALYKALGGTPCDASVCGDSGYYLYPCDAKVSFTFGGKKIDVSKAFNLGQPSGASSSYSSQCMGAFVGTEGVPLNAVIAGDTLFMSAYAVFDVDNSQVGFADYAS